MPSQRTVPRTKVHSDDRRQLQVRLDPETRARLEAEATRRRVSKTFMIEEMVRECLPRWEKQKLGAA
jgi:predicted transcriptional regulator